MTLDLITLDVILAFIKDQEDEYRETRGQALAAPNGYKAIALQTLRHDLVKAFDSKKE